MNTTYRSKKQVTRLMAASSHTLSLLMSMLRVSLEAAWSMARVWLEYAYSIFITRFLRPFSSKRAELERRLVLNEITARPLRDYGSSLMSLRLTISMFLMLTLGSSSVWGQTDYSGMYYIGNYNNNAYNVETPASNFYLVPAANPQQTHQIDAYYSANYGSEDGDPDQPFLTTYKTNKDANSVWRIEASGESGFYYIIHQNTGRYVIYEPVFSGGDSRRKSMHLKATNTPGDEAKFEFSPSKTGYAIRPKLVETGNRYFNVASANANAYYSTGPTGTVSYYNGLVGLYSDAGDKNGVWILEQATIDPPTITNKFDGTITIAAASGATIYYTTDGSTPTMSSPVYSTAITLTEDITVIKAIAKASADPFPTIVRTYEIPQCDKPNISVSGNYVSITCPTAGATIYYTTDNTPATTASAVYTVPFVKGSISTIRAVATSPGYIISSEAILLPPTEVSSSDEITDMRASYILASNFTSSGSIGTSENPFKGTIDGNFNQLTLNNPLVAYADGAIIKNVILSSVSISSGTNVGAICNEATGDTRIYNCGVLSGSVGGSNNVGGIVGLLDGRSRVINCYSYANITSGTNAGGIVGYNNVATIAENIRTMVMNCMFYGDITGGTNVSPVYGGETINNLQGGLNNFNYYSYTQLMTATITKYNCALAVEDKFLNRFEYYRLLLNSNKKLAAFYATGSHDNANEMAKWVLETANRTIDNPKPYPILKTQGYYPSIINPDFENAPDSASVGRNHGGKLGSKTLSVTINSVGSNAPSGANITTGSLTLTRTDKDFDRFNFNYDKVQLPYYNDVGTGNYTEYKVVTGWKITAITAVEGDPYTSANYPTTGITDFPNHNFADRKSSNKDLYSVSKRVFSQGAYFDVPYGVTSITIEPYWGQAAYISDQNYDVVYYNTNNTDYNAKQNVTQTGTQINKFNEQTVHHSMTNALNALTYGSTVYDKAVVLVGNLHLDGVPSGGDKAFTMMSVDEDNDHEPDYSLIYHHKGRTAICPIRFDFLNIPGTAQAQKPNGASLICNFTIFKTKGWFEVTNTSSFYTSQLEYENQASLTKSDAPLILLGGVIDQFVSTQSSSVDGHTIYIHLGSNVWINEFGMGTHSDGKQSTPHVPVSVTGGEFPGFYLTGTYKADATIRNDNAECYISGGYIHEAAGASLEQIGGNVRWQIYNADIENFFGGGINDAKPIKGDITTDIYNSHVTLFCGGPKFGNMQTGKKVSTNAEGCTFGKYFGAGYGGLSYSKKKYYDKDDDPVNWTTQQSNYTNDRGKYYDGKTTELKQGSTSYGFKGPGVATDFDYEYFVWTSGKTGGRFYVKFASFSLAQCNDVSSTLKKCTVETNFYGGGNLGKVIGTATSELEDCTVKGSVYGAGYSASLPTVEVRDAGFTTAPNFNKNSGMFEPGVFSGTTTFTWQNATAAGKTLTNGQSGSDLTNHILYTDTELTGLGEVAKAVLTINGTTTVGESVYGGGEESGVAGDTEVNVTGGTIGTEGLGGAEYGNVFGGGKGKVGDKVAGYVKGNTAVNISQAENKTTTIFHNVYGGGAYGSVGDFTYDVTSGMPTDLATTNTGACNVTVTGGTIGSNGENNGMVFGSSRGDVAVPGTDGVDPNDRMAWVYSTHVTIGDANTETSPTIKGSVYGSGENGHTFQNTIVDIKKGIVGITTGNAITDKNGTPEDPSDDATYSGADYPYRGNVYGGGCGTDKYDSNSDGKKDAYNPLAGIVRGNATVNITGGQVVHNVYGAGAMGSVGNSTDATSGKTTINVSGGRIGYDGSRNGNVFGAARGEYGISTDLTENLANVRETEVNINYTTTPTGDDNDKITQLIAGSVFGGGEAGTVKGSVAVEMTGGLILNDIYGGGALADTQTDNWDSSANNGAGGWANTTTTSTANTTVVNLLGGTIAGEAYGGGLGEAGKPAYVWGDILVDLNNNNNGGTADGTQKGCAVDQVFGCNNVNGTPKGSVTVHVYATQHPDKSQIGNTSGETPVTDAKRKNHYDVTAVYGGGNLAAYEPVDAYSEDETKKSNAHTNVIIDGCGLTSIRTVYGGGNAASTPATKVTVNGTFEIEELFGGGNGKDSIIVNNVKKANPGANVGFYDYSGVEDTYDTKEKRQQEAFVNTYVYGTGQASVNVFGGTIHRVFGGSNTKGNVRQTAVTLLDENSGCDFCVDEAYGGGKSAPMDAEAKLLMSCIPGLSAAYGGAEAADIQGNVTLNITNGTFDRVFGGNNLSGTINGSITVNVEEIGCRPVMIGELYGGGNQAGYSVYGYDSNDKPIESGVTPLYNDPQVNVKSFTSIGNIFGGGYGDGATMVGNPTVNINEVYGKYYNKEVSVIAENAKTPNNYPIPSHDKGKMGAINNVFGGGNAAKVIGNTNVNIGTLEEIYVVKKVTANTTLPDGCYTRSGTGTTADPFVYTAATGTAVEGTTYYEKIIGADIRGNVYGGGNNAEVTGNTNVTIGKKETTN